MSGEDGVPAEVSGRAWTIPNTISVLRLAGVVPLLWAAAAGARAVFLVVLALMLASDWADGKLAAWLDQRTELGARLDSAVDAAMYGSIALSCWWLETEAMRASLGWFAAAIGTWAISCLVSLVRFGRLPGYHTRGAKLSWLAVAATVLVWIGAGDARTVPWALGLVTAANLEAIAIGFTLPAWRADVPSIVDALRVRRAMRNPEAGTGAGAPGPGPPPEP